jgi:hypothetical protein
LDLSSVTPSGSSSTQQAIHTVRRRDDRTIHRSEREIGPEVLAKQLNHECSQRRLDVIKEIVGGACTLEEWFLRDLLLDGADGEAGDEAV